MKFVTFYDKSLFLFNVQGMNRMSPSSLLPGAPFYLRSALERRLDRLLELRSGGSFRGSPIFPRDALLSIKEGCRLDAVPSLEAF